MKKLTAILLMVCLLGVMDASAKRHHYKNPHKYWHRKHQNELFQRYLQKSQRNKGLDPIRMTQSFRPKKDHMAFVFKNW